MTFESVDENPSMTPFLIVQFVLYFLKEIYSLVVLELKQLLALTQELH